MKAWNQTWMKECTCLPNKFHLHKLKVVHQLQFANLCFKTKYQNLSLSCLLPSFFLPVIRWTKSELHPLAYKALPLWTCSFTSLTGHSPPYQWGSGHSDALAVTHSTGLSPSFWSSLHSHQHLAGGFFGFVFNPLGFSSSSFLQRGFPDHAVKNIAPSLPALVTLYPFYRFTFFRVLHYFKSSYFVYLFILIPLECKLQEGMDFAFPNHQYPETSLNPN